MSRHFINEALKWLHPRNQERDLISAAFHMIVITLISMSLVQLQWFTIYGNVCTPYLTLSQFFWFGYSDYELNSPEYSCIDGVIVNLMRIIILLCFMGIIFSVFGFFLHILGPKSAVYNFIRKYALASSCTVLWMSSIISTCHYVSSLLKDSLISLYPNVDTTVSFGYGYYLIIAAAGMSLVGTVCTLLLMHTFSNDSYQQDEACLIEDYNDSLDIFNSQTPPPPYNVPPPPYSP